MSCATSEFYLYNTITFLNNSFHEYLDHLDFKLIWVLRNPHSVVYSMLHNWRRSALNRLFKSCGSTQLTADKKKWFDILGGRVFSQTYKACLSYNAKMEQLVYLKQKMPSNRLMIIDYNDLVKNKNKALKSVCSFVGLEFQDYHSQLVNNKSVRKIETQSKREFNTVESLCLDHFKTVKSLVTVVPDQLNEVAQPLLTSEPPLEQYSY